MMLRRNLNLPFNNIGRASDDASPQLKPAIIVSSCNITMCDLPRRALCKRQSASCGSTTAKRPRLLPHLCHNAAEHTVWLQAGVGKISAGVLRLWSRNLPHCLLQSARRGKSHIVMLQEETIMAGLSCGEASSLALPIIKRRTRFCRHPRQCHRPDNETFAL